MNCAVIREMLVRVAEPPSDPESCGAGVWVVVSWWAVWSKEGLLGVWSSSQSQPQRHSCLSGRGCKLWLPHRLPGGVAVGPGVSLRWWVSPGCGHSLHLQSADLSCLPTSPSHGPLCLGSLSSLLLAPPGTCPFS